MKKLLSSLLALFAVGTLCANNLVSISKTTVAPKIDGFADDCYKNSMTMAGFLLPRSLEYAKDQTTLQLVYDNEYIYGLLTANQPNAGKLVKLTPTRDNIKIWKYDSVELFFQKENYLVQYMFDYSGSSYSLTAHLNDRLTWDNKKFDSKLRCATRLMRNRWILEFAIPRSEIGTGDLKFNIVRNHMGADKYSSWINMEEQNWRAMDKYATIKLVDKVPAMTFEVLPELKLDSKTVLNVQTQEKIAIDLFSSNGKKYAANTTNGKVEIKYATPPQNKSVRLELRDAKNALLYSYTHALAVEKITLIPNNLDNGVLMLDGGLRLESRLLWNNKHNLVGGNPKIGNRCEFPFTVTFEMPEGIALRNGKKIGEKVIDGKKIVIYLQKERYAYNAHSWIKSFLTTTLPEGASGVIRYKVEWKNGVQAFRDIKYQVVAIKPATPPKKFIAGFYHAWGSSMKQAEMFRNLGFNSISVRGYGDYSVKLARQLKAAGFFVRRGDYFWPGSTQHGGNAGFDYWTQHDRQARARDIGGFYIPNGSSFQISPTYRGKFFDQEIAKEVEFCKKAGISYFTFDMEGYIQSRGEKGDFSSRSINEFKKYFAKNYPNKKYIDPKDFERNPAKYPDYHKAWVNFKCDAWGEFFEEMKKRFAEGLGKDDLSAPFNRVIFSEWSFRRPWDLEGQNHCLRGEKFFRVFDIIELENYTSLDRGIRETNEKLANFARTFPDIDIKIIFTPSPMPLKDNHYGSLAPDYKDYLKFNIMEACGFGCIGVLPWHYNLANMDSLRQFSEGIKIVNKVEDIVLNGKKIKLSTNLPNISVTDTFYGKKATWHDQEPVFVKGLQYNDKYLICVSEYLTGKDMTVTVNFAPGKKMSIKNVETDKIIGTIQAADKTFKVRLEPENRCKLLLFEPVK